MIQIIPSVSIVNGKIVKVTRGNVEAGKIYDQSIVDMAKNFEDHGIEVLHMMDIDGARAGRLMNYDILQTVAGHSNLKIDFTGGISTDGDIHKAFEYGASYITAGSIAAINKDLFSAWIISYGREKITLGADIRANNIYIRGYQKDSDINVFDHIEHFYNKGLKYVKVFDLDRQGSMEGPSFELYAKIQERFPDICLLAMGGVRSVEDLDRLNDMGVFAAIIGQAFYEGTINLKDVERFLVKS